VARSLAVVAPNVRGSLGYGAGFLTLDDGRKRADAVQDIGALLDWIAQQPQLDKDRVAVVGTSGGEYGNERDPEMRQYLKNISPLHNADKITAAG